MRQKYVGKNNPNWKGGITRPISVEGETSIKLTLRRKRKEVELHDRDIISDE